MELKPSTKNRQNYMIMIYFQYFLYYKKIIGLQTIISKQCYISIGWLYYRKCR